MKTTVLKYSFGLIIGMGMTGSVFSQYVTPVRTTNSPAIIDPIVIDGLDNESSWSTSEVMPDPFMDDGWDGSYDLSGYFKTCWNYETFCFYARVTDDISDGANTPDENWWTWDYVWLYFNMDSSLAEGIDYLEDATNIAFNRELPDQISGELYYTPDRLALADMDFIVVNHDGYYTVEAAIPWVYFLPGPVEAIEPDDIYEWINSHMGFDVMFVDSDTDGSGGSGIREAVSAWDPDDPDTPGDQTEDNAWNNTSVFGIITMIGGDDLPPVADAGPDQEVMENTLVTLDGSGSYDPEGSDISYTWTAPGAITLSDKHVVSPTFTAPEVSADTDYHIGLVVNDGMYNSPVDMVMITVNQDNIPPVADAGPDQTVNERDLVMLDGSASYDFDSDPLTYSWTSALDINFIYASTATPLFVAPEVYYDDMVQLVLTVSDGMEDSESDTMNLYINSFFDTYDTLVVYDTVYVVDVENYYNTILISAVDDDGNLFAREYNGVLYIELYPNPTDQYIHIRSDMMIYDITVLDAVGTIITAETVNALTAEINLGGFTAGSYILRINSESGIINKQFVVE